MTVEIDPDIVVLVALDEAPCERGSIDSEHKLNTEILDVCIVYSPLAHAICAQQSTSVTIHVLSDDLAFP